MKLIFHRSAVFGRPLAQMLANAGAIVYSMDKDDTLLFSRPFEQVTSDYVVSSTHDRPKWGGTIESNAIMNDDILSSSDLIISAVPGDYQVKNVKLRAGCGLINVAMKDNFPEEMREKAAWYVPRVGLVTRRCLLLNALMARVARESGAAGTLHEER
jgi:5,10-methylene-tetrahydrofolate dehydrogenase/methenyl tetrahydrofolate cyclohydrolase